MASRTERVRAALAIAGSKGTVTDKVRNQKINAQMVSPDGVEERTSPARRLMSVAATAMTKNSPSSRARMWRPGEYEPRLVPDDAPGAASGEGVPSRTLVGISGSRGRQRFRLLVESIQHRVEHMLLGNGRSRMRVELTAVEVPTQLRRDQLG